jgi:hypothetical protein
MVLRRLCSSRRIIYNREMTGLLNILLVVLACVSLGGCRDTQADHVADESACQGAGLKVDDRQMSHIKDSLQKLFQWEAYWTYNDDESKSSYKEKIGRPLSIEVFSLRRGVIVFISGLENSVVKFRKTADGDLSNPQFVRGGAGVDFDGDKLTAIANALGDWREFLFLAGAETAKGLDQPPLLIPASNMKSYIEHNRDTIKYCQTSSDIALLPLKTLTYDPMDDRKQALLDHIVAESTDLAQTMFTKGHTVVISVPNFNLNDDRIWVLLEESKVEAYTISLKLDAMNTETPVKYMNTVEIKSAPKYGIRIGADEKIRRAPIKVLRYKVQ